MKKRSVIVIAIFVALVVASMAIVLGTGMLQPSIAEKTDSPVSSQALNKENSENSIEVESNIVESENTSNISEISKKNEPSIKESSNSSSTSSKPSGSGNGGSTSSSSSSSSKPSGNGSGSSSSKPSGGNSSSSPKPSSGSSSSTPSHSHSYSSKTVKATCTSGGYTVHTCSCGASYTDSYTDATGHRWSDWKTVKKATTSSEGRKQRTCNSCGKTESKTIAKVQGSSTSGGHRITGARKAVYSYRGDHGDKWSNVNLVDLINEERAKEGLGKLEWTADVLTRLVKDDPDIADAYSDYFDSNGKFNPYIDPEVREPLEGAQKMANMGYATHGNGVGCHCVGASEGASTIEEALRRQIKAYMNSSEHRAILMNAGSHSVTAAYAIDSNGTVYTAILVGG